MLFIYYSILIRDILFHLKFYYIYFKKHLLVFPKMECAIIRSYVCVYTKFIFYIFIIILCCFNSIRPHDSNKTGHAFQVYVVYGSHVFIFFVRLGSLQEQTCHYFWVPQVFVPDTLLFSMMNGIDTISFYEFYKVLLNFFWIEK